MISIELLNYIWTSHKVRSLFIAAKINGILKNAILELWDKDGYAFVQAEEIEEDTEEDLDFIEYQLEERRTEVEVDDDDEELKKSS
jgi:hypothetical protein